MRSFTKKIGAVAFVFAGPVSGIQMSRRTSTAEWCMESVDGGCFGEAGACKVPRAVAFAFGITGILGTIMGFTLDGMEMAGANDEDPDRAHCGDGKFCLRQNDACLCLSEAQCLDQVLDGDTGFFPDGDFETCDPCQDNCKGCSGSDRCESCVDGHVLWQTQDGHVCLSAAECIETAGCTPPPNAIPPTPEPTVEPTVSPTNFVLRELMTQCDNSCLYADDVDCDDGGLGSDYSLCHLGTDCNDCCQKEGDRPECHGAGRLWHNPEDGKWYHGTHTHATGGWDHDYPDGTFWEYPEEDANSLPNPQWDTVNAPQYCSSYSTYPHPQNENTEWRHRCHGHTINLEDSFQETVSNRKLTAGFEPFPVSELATGLGYFQTSEGASIAVGLNSDGRMVARFVADDGEERDSEITYDADAGTYRLQIGDAVLTAAGRAPSEFDSLPPKVEWTSSNGGNVVWKLAAQDLDALQELLATRKDHWEVTVHAHDQLPHYPDHDHIHDHDHELDEMQYYAGSYAGSHGGHIES